MTERWEALWGRCIWWLMPEGMKASLVHFYRLGNDLFVELPRQTKYRFVSQATQVLRYPTLIETGTFQGDMTWHASRLFREVHTIEIDKKLAEQAASRFAKASHVTVHHGDSSRVLPELSKTISTSCIFWLDGHYSGG